MDDDWGYPILGHFKIVVNVGVIHWKKSMIKTIIPLNIGEAGEHKYTGEKKKHKNYEPMIHILLSTRRLNLTKNETDTLKFPHLVRCSSVMR